MAKWECFVFTMHENITLFSIVLRWFIGFLSPDYQPMKLFDGQNRLIISSHTNVSVAFPLFSSEQLPRHMYPILQKHNVHQEKKKPYYLPQRLILFFNTSLFFLAFFVLCNGFSP